MKRICGFVTASLVVLVAGIGYGASVATPGHAANGRAERQTLRYRDCTSDEAHQVVVNFIRAFNFGNSVRLDALFAKDDGDGDAATPSFQWYSTGSPGRRLGRAADDRSTLIPYFAARHKRGERLGLLWMSHGGGLPGKGYFGFGFHVHRQARDLQRPGAFEGKGAVICVTGRPQIAVWSVGPRLSTG